MHSGGLVLLKDYDIRVTLINKLNKINAHIRKNKRIIQP